jgi:5-methylcytosine-specific restriction endonuclease McrA
MQKHTRIYLDSLGYTDTDFVSCEVCGKCATDVHHIEARGMGGSKERDTIDNLQALCRPCHIKYGDRKDLKPFLIELHKERMKQRDA